jgi:hypothetical protein
VQPVVRDVGVGLQDAGLKRVDVAGHSDSWVGPDAFTAPTDTAEGGACDKAALLAELESRPDALREWAAVLGV